MTGDGSGLNADPRLVPISDDGVFFDAWREALAGEFQRYDVVQGQDGSVVTVDEETVASAAETAGVDAPQAEASADLSVSSGESSGAGDDFTTTNVQEQGVDEADLVKNDGEFLYVLQPYSDYCDFCDLPVVDTDIEVVEFTEQAEDTSVSTSEPGFNPSGQRQATLRILSLQPDVPDATPVVGAGERDAKAQCDRSAKRQ